MSRQRADSQVLLSNAGATGNAVSWAGGKAHFVLVAVAGGGTTALQLLGPDGTTWVGVTGASSATSVSVPLDLPAGQYRAFVSGGTPSGIYASLLGVL